LVLIEGADHFFEGRLRELREAIEAWVKEAVSPSLPLSKSKARDST
jgi:alpha/beta superfamily hydrolase